MSVCSSTYKRATRFGIVVALLSALCPAVTAVAQDKGHVINVKVHGRALEGNLSGEPADRDVSIYLPPSYDREARRRYPVVYLLHGYSLTNAYWVGNGSEGPPSIDVPGAMDRDIASGKSREMILVMPNGDSKYNGSMYSNSVTSGNWEAFIAEDLVGYIDTHYRTIAERAGRGLAGHSMGGYGTIRIGMKRADVFASLYILSACCLMNDAVAFARRAAQANASAQQSSSGADSNARPRRGFPNVINAEAAAWSPNPKNPPNYFDLPGTEGPEAALVAAKWAANSPLAMIDQYIPNLRLYDGIGMDVGTQDGLNVSNKQLADVLTAYGIDHSFETYEGDHVNRIGERMEQHVLPFFSAHLAGQKGH